jgi:hypothetical protein
MKTRLLTILARFGTDRYAGAAENIRALLAKSCPLADCRMLIVDNALQKEFQSELDSCTRLIGGDDRAREFSGWDRAITYLGDELAKVEVVHLATAAYNQLYTKYLERFDDAIVRLVADRPVAVGHIDYYPYAVTAFGHVSQHWLRSSYVFIAPRELRMLGPLAAVRRSGLFSGSPACPFRADAPISDGYRSLIIAWLTSATGTGQGTAWHSRFQLDPTTLGLFEDKAVAIVNEHLLSARLRGQGCSTVDVTWLSTVMKQTGIVFGPIPGWRRQLATRDTDACQPPAASIAK